MSGYFDVMTEFFESDGWNPARVSGEQILQMDFRAHEHTWRCYAFIGQDPRQIIFYSAFPLNAAAAVRLKMAEFLTRVNSGLPTGNFELDFETGAVRFKTSILMDEEPLRPTLLQAMVYTNVAMMGHYFNSLMAIIHGKESAAEIANMMQLLA